MDAKAFHQTFQLAALLAFAAAERLAVSLPKPGDA
jgi:hypothetical protein